MGEADDMELMYSLIGYPNETEWIEFKTGNNEPNHIGRDISALANSAAYLGRTRAYKLWGVSDDTHTLTGTSFNPYQAKGKGNQDLLIWLRTFLSNHASYEFRLIQHNGLSFVVLEIEPAVGKPVYFDNVAYIREGSSTTRLIAGSTKESKLWMRLQSSDFESKVAERDVTAEEVVEKLDIDTYFSLLDMRVPGNIESILHSLTEQELIAQQDNGRFSILNLGALLIARRLSSFSNLRKRVLRVVSYNGKNLLDIASDVSFDQGYALAIPAAERHIVSLLPSSEYMDGAFRRIRIAYPKRAIRELLSNMLIHQDLSDGTSSPVVSLFQNRIEFSNPGATLIPVARMLNAQPKSRNASLARQLRQMYLCEEQGSGWDIVVAACEQAHMAAPRVESDGQLGTRVTLLAENAYERMRKAERKDAVYWHACLMFAQGESMGNQSLRERFGLDGSRKNLVAISRLIKECCDEGLIKEEDEDAGDRYRRYIPAWA